MSPCRPSFRIHYNLRVQSASTPEWGGKKAPKTEEEKRKNSNWWWKIFQTFKYQQHFSPPTLSNFFFTQDTLLVEDLCVIFTNDGFTTCKHLFLISIRYFVDMKKKNHQRIWSNLLHTKYQNCLTFETPLCTEKWQPYLIIENACMFGRYKVAMSIMAEAHVCIRTYVERNTWLALSTSMATNMWVYVHIYV